MLNAIATADWLDRSRVTWYPVIIIGILVAATGYVLVANGGTLPNGSPFGADFISFWVAAREALAGNPIVAYSRETFEPLQVALFPDAGHFAFFYPPHYQMMLMPFGTLPFYGALIMWQVVTFALVGWVIWRISGNKALAVVLALAFPAAFLNAAHGQNAFLSAGLFAAGLYLLPSRPVLAGVMFGVLTFKPQLGLLIPFALLAAWQWRAIVSAGVTTFLLAGASALVLGSAVWPAFLAQGSAAMDVLHEGTVGWHKLISVYSGLRGFGLPYGVAMGAHVMIALGVAATVIMAWRPQSGISHPMRCAMLMTGALIVTPFGLNYDLYLLAPAGAFFLAAVDWSEMDGIERNTVIAGFVLPVTVLLTMASGYSLAAWTVPIVFVALARRAFEPDAVPGNRSIAPAE